MKSNKKDKQELRLFFDWIFSAFTGVLIAFGGLVFWVLLGANLNGVHLSLALFLGCAYAIADYSSIQKIRELRELKLKGGKK